MQGRVRGVVGNRGAETGGKKGKKPCARGSLVPCSRFHSKCSSVSLFSMSCSCASASLRLSSTFVERSRISTSVSRIQMRRDAAHADGSQGTMRPHSVTQVCSLGSATERTHKRYPGGTQKQKRVSSWKIRTFLLELLARLLTLHELLGPAHTLH